MHPGRPSGPSPVGRDRSRAPQRDRGVRALRRRRQHAHRSRRGRRRCRPPRAHRDRPAPRGAQRRHLPRDGHRSRRREDHPRRRGAERARRRRGTDAAHAPVDRRCRDGHPCAHRREPGQGLRRQRRPHLSADVHGHRGRGEPGREGDVDGGGRPGPGNRSRPRCLLRRVQRRGARAVHGQGQEGPGSRLDGRPLDREQAGGDLPGVPARRPRRGDGRLPTRPAGTARRARLGGGAGRERGDGQDEAAERVPSRGA